MVLADWQLERMTAIQPFEKGEKRPNTISYGVSSYGYDIRVDEDVYVFSADPDSGVIDPKKFDPLVLKKLHVWQDTTGRYVILPPHSFALCRSVETIRVPRSCLVTVMGKSTYARCGLILNVTPLEPEWVGTITLELSNTTPYPVKVYVNEGIGQLIFHRGQEECRTSYADKVGKYQNQVAVTLPKVD